MNLKADTEYMFKTGNTISDDGTIPLKQMQEIVRCKDCRYFRQKDNFGVGVCATVGIVTKVNGDDYCSLAERKGKASK